MDEQLSITVSQAPNGVTLIALSGDLDIATTDQLRSTLDRIGSASRIVIDASGLQFIDSTGLNELALRSRRAATRGGLLMLAGVSPHLARVFDVVRLQDSVRIEGSVEKAVSGAGAHTAAD
jgi:anti-anti-sigma factor